VPEDKIKINSQKKKVNVSVNVNVNVNLKENKIENGKKGEERKIKEQEQEVQE